VADEGEALDAEHLQAIGDVLRIRGHGATDRWVRMPKTGQIESEDPAAKPGAQLDPPLRGVEQSVQDDEGAFVFPAPASHTELTAVAEAKGLDGTQRPFGGSELLTRGERRASYRPRHGTAAKARRVLIVCSPPVS
jgi:hypothetical protein